MNRYIARLWLYNIVFIASVLLKPDTAYAITYIDNNIDYPARITCFRQNVGNGVHDRYLSSYVEVKDREDAQKFADMVLRTWEDQGVPGIKSELECRTEAQMTLMDQKRVDYAWPLALHPIQVVWNSKASNRSIATTSSIIVAGPVQDPVNKVPGKITMPYNPPRTEIRNMFATQCVEVRPYPHNKSANVLWNTCSYGIETAYCTGQDCDASRYGIALISPGKYWPATIKPGTRVLYIACRWPVLPRGTKTLRGLPRATCD